MKRKLFTLLTTVLFSSAFAQWNPQTSNNSGQITSMYFPLSNAGFAVTDSDTILSTANSGATWSFNFAAGNPLYNIMFTDPNTGFCCGANGSVYTTVDGGNSWIYLSTAQANSLYGIYFTDPNTGWAVGAAGTIIHTTNGGSSWTVQTSGTSNPLNSVWFVDANNGFAAGVGGTILRTSDAGATWIAQTSGTSNVLYAIQFIDMSTGYACGANGTILGTTDGGTIWTAQTSGTTELLTGMKFLGANGFVCGQNGTMLKTVDGGGLWFVQSSGTAANLNSVFFTSIYNGYAGGANGTIINTLDGGCPTPNISAGGPFTICDMGSTNLSATGGSAFWNWTPAAGLSASNIANPTAGPTVSTTYTIEAYSSDGCYGFGQVVVNVAAPLVANLSSVPSSCYINDGNATATPTGGYGAYSYMWSDSQGNSTAWNLAPADYTCTVTDAIGCTATETITVGVTGNPTATVSSQTNVTCYGGNDGSAVVSASGGTTPYTYSWNSVPSQSNDTAINLFAGGYTVTVYDNYGCTATATVALTQGTQISIATTYTNQTYCVPNGWLSANATGGTPAYTYTWYPGGYVVQTPAGMSAGNYTVVVSDANGCKDSTTTVLGFTNMFTANINGPSFLCHHQPAQFTMNTNGGNAPYTFNWQMSALVSSNDTAFFNAPTVGIDTVKLTLFDVQGCSTNAIYTVQVNAGDSLSGLIKEPNSNPVTAGKVYLFEQKINNVGVNDTLGFTNIGANGIYAFKNVPFGNYYLKAVADTSSGLYPTSIGTYFSSRQYAYQFDSADVINQHFCSGGNATGFDVTILEISPNSGPGQISGIITEGAGYGQRIIHGNSVLGAPLKGVDIKLGKNPGGSPAARTTTDNTGAYTFTNLPVNQSYRIYVDIPNYGMDSILIVNLTSADSISDQNNYYVDSLMVRVDTASGVGIVKISETGIQMTVFPNPTAGKLYVEVKSKDKITLSVHDVFGNTVLTETLTSEFEELNLADLAEGVYFVQIKTPSKTLTKKIILQR